MTIMPTSPSQQSAEQPQQPKILTAKEPWRMRMQRLLKKIKEQSIADEIKIRQIRKDNTKDTDRKKEFYRSILAGQANEIDRSFKAEGQTRLMSYPLFFYKDALNERPELPVQFLEELCQDQFSFVAMEDVKTGKRGKDGVYKKVSPNKRHWNVTFYAALNGLEIGQKRSAFRAHLKQCFIGWDNKALPGFLALRAFKVSMSLEATARYSCTPMHALYFQTSNYPVYRLPKTNETLAHRAFQYKDSWLVYDYKNLKKNL